MNAYIGEYTDFMRNTCHKSANTVESYKRDVTQYVTYLSELGISNIKNTTQTNVLSYIMLLQKMGRATSTVSRVIASIRSYYLYLLRNGQVNADPTVTLSSPRIEKKPPHALTNGEITLLLEQPKLSDNKGIRDKAMLELLYATGIRVSELIGLDVSDVNLSMGYIRCSNNKSERLIPVGNKAVDSLKLYLEKARIEMLKDVRETALFVNRMGDRISRQGFWKIIKHYQETSGIECEITPHSLRHSFAAHLIQNGADLESLKSMMGHSDISSTQVYTCFLDDNIKRVYEKTHPRA
ncbi:MAG: tyrosine recombinase [Clostridia bacterium]|nr:tyrosine recombinase [Clostridia bacterium]